MFLLLHRVYAWRGDERVYRLCHSGSYNPPRCCNGYHCHDSHHKWMIGRCCCLGCSKTWGRRHDRGRGPGSPDSDLKTHQPLTGTSQVFNKICIFICFSSVYLWVQQQQQHPFSCWRKIQWLLEEREKTSKLSQEQVGEVPACVATDWCVTHLYRYSCTASGWNSCSCFLCSLQRWTFHSSLSCGCSASAAALLCRGPHRGPLHRALIAQQTLIILYRCVTHVRFDFLFILFIYIITI